MTTKFLRGTATAVSSKNELDPFWVVLNINYILCDMESPKDNTLFTLDPVAYKSCINPIRRRSLGCKTVVKQKTLSASQGKVSAHDARTCQPILCRQEKEMSNSSLLTNRWGNLRTLTICFTWPIPFIELPTISEYLYPKWPIVSFAVKKHQQKTTLHL